MAIKKISEFEAHSGTIDGQLLMEVNGEGRSLKLVTLEISLSNNHVVSEDMDKLARVFTAINQNKDISIKFWSEPNAMSATISGLDSAGKIIKFGINLLVVTITVDESGQIIVEGGSTGSPILKITATIFE